MHPKYKHIRRKSFLIGSIAIVIGMLGALLPMLPGTFFTLLGLSILSIHSKKAHRLFVKLRTRFPKIANSIKSVEMQTIDFFNLTTHKRTYTTIPRNTNGNISILLELTDMRAGIAIILHSASGMSEDKTMDILAETYRARGFSIVRFDAFNSFGDQDGDYSQFNTINYLSDLEIVVTWAKKQTWWNSPLVLIGHSVGGLVAGLYATEHQKEINKLVLLSPSLSGASLEQNLIKNDEQAYRDWQTSGTKSVQNPITKKKHDLSYSFVENMKNYDLTTCAKNLLMPVSIFAGTKDKISTIEENATFCGLIGNNATLTKLTDVHHTPRNKKEFETLYKFFTKIEFK